MIKKLTEKAAHIPYRDSKLTFLLQVWTACWLACLHGSSLANPPSNSRLPLFAPCGPQDPSFTCISPPPTHTHACAVVQDSLGGNARTAVVCCVNPCSACQADTLGTLGFATRAKQLINKASNPAQLLLHNRWQRWLCLAHWNTHEHAMHLAWKATEGSWALRWLAC